MVSLPMIYTNSPSHPHLSGISLNFFLLPSPDTITVEPPSNQDYTYMVDTMKMDKSYLIYGNLIRLD